MQNTHISQSARRPGILKRAFWTLKSHEGLYPTTPYGQQHVTARYQFALSQMPLEGQIVDIGTATGYGIVNSGALHRFVGLDRNKYALRLGEYHHPELRGRLVHGDAVDLSQFRGMPGITALEFIDHLRRPQKERFLQESEEALAPNGVLVMSTPLSFKPRTLDKFHFRKELTLDAYRRLVEGHFPDTRYYGIGLMPRTRIARYTVRAKEALISLDPLQLRRVLPRRARSSILHTLHGPPTIRPLDDYIREGTLPRNIISVSVKK